MIIIKIVITIVSQRSCDYRKSIKNQFVETAGDVVFTVDDRAFLITLFAASMKILPFLK